jgi:rSAM/selenodomain-associated transferase 1
MPHCECLILFTRYPEPGTTKTRLIPQLGPVGAADLQRQMTAHIVAQALPLKESRNLKVEVRYDGGDEGLMRAWLGDALRYRPQGPGDIGRRMARAFCDARDRGHTSIVVIGADIPEMTTALLNRAFETLQNDTVVLGPAADGGYYLIGLPSRVAARPVPDLFSNMAWGTATVLPETCRRLQRKGLAYTLLETLNDVDRPADLPIWEQCQSK